MADTKQCAHPSCNCPVKDGEKYCCATCKGSGDSPEIACNCGHSGCSGQSLTQ